ncbi:MAG TPA: alpha-L-arabinofuranosidase C-terminal domain-containing protein, partial [Opitutaceae bacterium]|nr:alpha-L-arabinofuranosidase C-terminal domain-containing protein [Opitutaceae bacterium]
PGSDRTYKTPLFYTIQLFSQHCRGTALRTFVDCDTFASGYYSRIPYLDVSSVYDAQSKQLVINVVNRKKDEAIATDLESITGSFTGAATVSTIASDGVADQAYTYAARASYAPKVEQAPAQGSRFHWEFPAHSFTQIVIGIAR